VASLLVSCRRGGSLGPPPAPTVTVTPVSTPLPPVATAIPPGADRNPIQMIVVPVTTSSSAANNAAEIVQEALREETGLTIEVIAADSYAEAFGALCESSGGTVHVAWVDGMTYTAADAEGCGTPALMVERGTGRTAKTGEVVQILVNADSAISGISGLAENTFCRVDYSDLYTWLIPSVMLQAGGVNPISDLDSITDYADTTDLLDAVVSRDCDAAGMTESEFQDIADADARDAVDVIEESVEIPYAVLMYPPETPLGVRVALDDALIAAAGNDEISDALEDLLGQSDLVRIEADDLSDLREFVANSGLNLSQLND
jgi:ABC-type phosphate/phosphonate transport system substrate-binding protein